LISSHNVCPLVCPVIHGISMINVVIKKKKHKEALFKTAS